VLRFPLFGIPVGVHATFLFVALLGATAYRGWDIAWWTIAAFVSILLHELGHALSARAFGATGISITLYGLGGLTSYSHGREMSHGRSFVVSAAGSFTGIVSGGAVWYLASTGTFDGASGPVVVLVNSFVFTALVWGVLNWIPIVPLDGGHMVVHLVSMVNEERAPLIGQVITWTSIAILGPIAWVNGYRFAVLILGFFAFMGLRDYREGAERRRTSARTGPGTGQLDEAGAATPPDATDSRYPSHGKDEPDFPI
jgi:stage IV sporulation protein FB